MTDKSKLWKFEIDDRVETTAKYFKFFRGKYDNGVIKNVSNLESNSIITFFSDATKTFESMDEAWLQPYKGERYTSNGDQITSTTIDDILKNKNE